MKKSFILLVVLTLTMILSGCVMFIPSSDSIGEPKTFQKEGITLLLTDQFKEEESQLGFDAYYVSDFCGVMVKKEAFTLEEGLEDKELSEYIEGVIRNNGHTDIEPENKDGLWFYVKETDNSLVYYSYCYKGTDAFWIVQFACSSSDLNILKDTIYLWAQAIEVE